MSKAPTPRGAMVDVGGRRLHAVLAGPTEAVPLVVLEAGAFGFSADWFAVQEELAARRIRSLAYDRAGLGFSDPGPRPRDGSAIADDLEALLAAIGETGPLALCGHSMAGLHLRLFAARNRPQVLGVVLVDATTPEAMDSRVLSEMVDQFGTLSRAAAWAAGAGVFRLFSGTSWGDKIGLPGVAGEEKRWAFASPRHNLWSAEEVASWRATAREAAAAGTFDPDLPTSVLLAQTGRGHANLREIQIAPALASKAGRIEEVAGSNHASILSGDYAEVIVREIERVMAAARAC